MTDMWNGYSPLGSLGYIHKEVNHSENYVNPETLNHTQGVELAWETTNWWLCCEIQNRALLQSHLSEVSWRMMHGSDFSDLLPCFLDDVKTYYE